MLDIADSSLAFVSILKKIDFGKYAKILGGIGIGLSLISNLNKKEDISIITVDIVTDIFSAWAGSYVGMMLGGLIGGPAGAILGTLVSILLTEFIDYILDWLISELLF